MISASDFKKAARHWVTGVAVVTTRAPDGVYHGITMNALSPLSLDPPLFLICVAKTSETGAAILKSGFFCIHFLSEDQETLSMHFATKGENKFSEVEIELGASGSPLISGVACQIECKTRNVIDEGDHFIIIGAVEEVNSMDRTPLVYYSSKFHRLADQKRAG